jgi:outer membrane protein OmpA-like peptidoglycan-associated protein
MKKFIIVTLILTVYSPVLFSQDKKIKLPSIGFQFSLIDFPTAQDLRKFSVSEVIDQKQWWKTERMKPALTLNYAQGLSKHVDFMARFTSALLRYPFRNDNLRASDDKYYAELDANVNIKLLTDRYIVVPYLQAGIGASAFQGSFMAQVPLGVGLQIHLGSGNFINLNSNYRIPVTSPANYNLMHSIGVLSPIVDEKPVVKPLPPAPLPPADGDGDGVVDSLDLCPDVAGLADMKGCPDSDKDGISDKDDKCPNEAGLAKYNGCPIPDTDKDGINDEVDKCPDVAGVERYEGCPIPDTDKDGINDEEDKCPAQAGTAEEAGCPPVEYNININNLLFKLGSSVLSAKSKKELDLLSVYLTENTDVKVYLSGHADSTGTEMRNTALSLERAQNTAAYLTSKGVASERIISEGMSSGKPVADNNTEKGRMQNRRVEFKLKRY